MILQKYIAWFPSVILLAAMILPISISHTTLPMLSIPMLIAVWLGLAVYQQDLKIPKLVVLVLALLVLSQCVLLVMGKLGMPYFMWLGVLWIFLGVGVWAMMDEYQEHTNVFCHIFIFFAAIWLILTSVVWFGGTEQGKPIFIGSLFALTGPMNSKMTGPFFNSNVFSVLMLCAWCISTSLMLKIEKYKWAYAALSFCFLTVMFMGMSRGTWLSWLVVWLILLIGLFKLHRKEDLFKLLLYSVSAWFFADWLVNIAGMEARLNEKVDEILSPGVRVTLYASVFEVWREHWFSGVGLGNLAGHYLTGQASALSYLPNDALGLGASRNAHNHFLQLLAEAGLFGLTLWLMASYALLRGFYHCIFCVESKAWWAFATAFLLWFQGLFNVSMLEPIPFFLFCICLGLGMAIQHKEQMLEVVIVSKKYGTPALMILAFVLCIQSVVVTQGWLLYSDVLWRTHTAAERGPKVAALMPNGNTYPLLIQLVATDLMAKEHTKHRMVDIQPYIQDALAMEEWPLLYQSLFYTYTLQGNWDKACSLAIFLQQQRWANDLNGESYSAACQGDKVEGFSLAW